MASPACTADAPRAGVRLPSRRPSPSAVAPSAHVTLRRRSLPTRGPRGLRRAGSEWPEPAFVTVVEKLDAARKARAAAGTDDGEEEMGRTGAISGVGGGAVEEPVAVPFELFEQNLVVVDSVGDDALSQALGSKLPKLLEIVGLGYTLWFNTRYLLFKDNRDELRVKSEDLKKRIVGSGDE